MRTSLNTILAELQDTIVTAVPTIVGLLGATTSDVRRASLNALCRLAEHGEYNLLKCQHHSP